MEYPQSDGQSEGVSAAKDYIGVLDVHVHQARDITNICIYHNQDVAAKVCLTNDPENMLSTQIIDGGGSTPVFNQTLRLNVRTVNCSLKCEVWMISRAKIHLEDQLLGFALVPLSEVLILGNGKLEKEFALSSTDLFHSPAGFVQLSLSYTGCSPDVTVIPSMTQSVYDTEVVESLSCQFEKIEFPDPKIVCENHLMVSEYLSIPSPDCLAATDSENGSSCGSHPASFQSFVEIQEDSKSPNKEFTPHSKELSKENNPRPLDSGDQEANAPPVSECSMPVIVSVENVREKEEVVAKDIVDMYMKSMQQFTESLAKMNLPLDADNSSSGPNSSRNSNSDQNSQTTPKSSIRSRVFYGSRAFF